MGDRPQSLAPAVRQGRGAETRAAILGAAESIFADVGLDGARTDAIAARAGVNKALLYYYFKSKDALFRAVLEDQLREFRRCALEILGAEGSGRFKLIGYMSLHFDFVSSRPYYPRLVHRLMSSGSRRGERLFRDYWAPLYRKLVEIIERGVRAREFRPIDSHQAVYSLVALSVFYFSAAPIVKAVSHVDPFDPANVKRRKEEVLKLIRYGLFRDPEAPWR